MGKRVIIGQNDIATTHPHLSQEWNYERNGSVFPTDVSSGSNKRVWWRCKEGHEWEAVVASRASGYGCPYCAGQRVLVGKNDLASQYPNIAKEWDYSRNDPLTPSEIAYGTRKKVWWKCTDCGHSWQAAVANRVQGTGCPKCNLRNKTSFPEQAILFYLKQIYPDITNGYRDIFTRTMELDIFIPSIKIGIEYDGKAWHYTEKHYKREKNKYQICKENGITLIRIKEDETYSDQSTSDLLLHASTHPKTEDFVALFMAMGEYLQVPQNVDVDRDRLTIMNEYASALKEKSLLARNPEVANEWDYELNNGLLPSMVNENSNVRVWWRCKNNHSWKAVIGSRNKGSGCPYCAGQRAIIGENDLATTFPKLLQEWDFDKNTNLHPQEVTSGSSRPIWWKCKAGHSWQATVHQRTALDSGCPFCAGQRAITGETDLATVHPNLVREWNHEKNSILPTDITKSSGQKVWWRCSKGHEWQATVSDRVEGTGCPICSNRQVLIGYNDLETHNPELSSEWNYEKNDPLRPTNVTYSSSKKVWWKCTNGHEWQSSIYRRHNGIGCPYCSGRYVQKGESDLASQFPELLSEWDYEKNEITPDNIHAGSNKSVWWKCQKGHEWKTAVYKRTQQRTSCPFCSNKKLLVGTNDFATVYPDIALEWDYAKNAQLTPKDVMYGSGKKVWWRCRHCGHEWETAIYLRSKGHGCPKCSRNRKIIK